MDTHTQQTNATPSRQDEKQLLFLILMKHATHLQRIALTLRGTFPLAGPSTTESTVVEAVGEL